MDRYIPSSFASVFLWGMAVLLGMIGLGRLVAIAMGAESAKKAGWGLHAVWGMGVYLFVGASLSLGKVCGATTIVLIIGAGLAVTIWTTIRGGRPTRAALVSGPWGAWPVFAVAALTLAGGLVWQMNGNFSDDLPAYYPFCEKLLATGSFDEPFSWRRLASLGGQTLLQCSVLAQTSFANAKAFEVGLCPVILLGLVYGFRRGALARSPLGLLLGLLAVTTPIIRINSASHFTGVVILVGLFVTLDLAEREETRRFRWLAVAGMIAAGLCSLRASYVPAAGGALGLFWLASWIKDRRPLREALMEGGWLCAISLVALLPWMAMGFRSNGSPLFPLFQGDNNLAFNPQTTNAPLPARLFDLMTVMTSPALLPLVICSLAAPGWKRWAHKVQGSAHNVQGWAHQARGGVSAQAMALAVILASLAVAYSIPLPPDKLTIPRYIQPMLLAGAMVSLMTAAVSLHTRVTAWVLVFIVMTTSLPERAENLWDCYQQLGYTDKLVVPFQPRVIVDHREAQKLIPEGKRVLVCSDFPFLFEFGRNPIWIVDLPFNASPKPGLPYHRPPEEMKRYLRGLGVEYVIFENFDDATFFYSRALREQQLGSGVPMLLTEAPYFLDFFDTIEHLAASETTLGHAGNLTVIQFKP
jgi:hypothetical protein